MDFTSLSIVNESKLDEYVYWDKKQIIQLKLQTQESTKEDLFTRVESYKYKLDVPTTKTKSLITVVNKLKVQSQNSLQDKAQHTKYNSQLNKTESKTEGISGQNPNFKQFSKFSHFKLKLLY